MSDIDISLVMATMNEEKAIEEVVRQFRQATEDYRTEILIVDSSEDRTPQIAEKIGVKVISQPPKGHGYALWTGLMHARGEIIVTSDCDMTYPVEIIPAVMEQMRDYDVISTNRICAQNRRNMPLANWLANKVFALLVRIIYSIETHDVATGMIFLKKAVVQKIDWKPEVAFPPEIIIKTKLYNFRYREIDIPYFERTGATKLNRWRGGMAYLRCIFSYIKDRMK